MADRAALAAALEMERAPLQPMVRLTSWLVGLLPDFAFTRTRSRLLGLVGWKLGPGASIFGVPTVVRQRTDPGRVCRWARTC